VEKPTISYQELTDKVSKKIGRKLSRMYVYHVYKGISQSKAISNAIQEVLSEVSKKDLSRA
jgi:hypothetical protein